jgi:hypothetical protein
MREKLTIFNAFLHDVATGDVVRDRIKLLEVKHALLGIVFAAGTAWQVDLVYGS